MAGTAGSSWLLESMIARPLSALALEEIRQMKQCVVNNNRLTRPECPPRGGQGHWPYAADGYGWARARVTRASCRRPPRLVGQGIKCSAVAGIGSAKSAELNRRSVSIMILSAAVEKIEQPFRKTVGTIFKIGLIGWPPMLALRS